MKPEPKHVLRALSLALALVPLGCGGSGPAGSDGSAAPLARGTTITPFPDFGAGRQYEPGVLVDEVVLTTGGRLEEGKVWVYLPEKRSAKPIPAVLIAPAGSPLIFGMKLGDGDRAEHLPYVHSGFAVVAYSLNGHLDDAQKSSDAAAIAAARAFRDSEAGLADARRALDFVVAKVPAIDPERLYSAGHSSAATLSLLFAENEPRLKGCIAFAPCSDVEKRLDPRLVQGFGRSIPGFADFIRNSSPRNHASRLACPLFLFHADDDSNVPVAESVAFAESVKETNPKVTFVRAKKGNHYDSMIREGIPRAIRWLRDQSAAAAK
jgi:dipeptidyl aminopeptidase/acylaminoacyl peptidase